MDILKSIRAVLYERLSSPLISSFVIAWIVWNFKLLLVITASIPIAEKFKLIDYGLYSGLLERTALLLVGPLITSTAYVFGYPYIEKHVFKFWRERQKELKEIQQKIENETPVSLEQWRQLKQELIDLQTRYDTDIERKDEQIKQLRRQLETQPQPTQTAKMSATDGLKLENFTSLQVELLEAVAEAERQNVIATEKWIQSKVKGDKIEKKYLLEDLTNRRYLKHDYSSRENDYYYELIHDGRYALLTLGKAGKNKNNN